MNPEIRKAARILKRGGVVAFPTETVYGLGAVLSSARGLRKIFRVKGRPADNPLIVHVADRRQLAKLAEEVPEPARMLMRRFWPGPLTLVLRRSRSVPPRVTAGLDTVAVRMPRHPVALGLIRAAGEPIAAPSANRSGRPSPTHYAEVLRELGGRADLVLKGGRSHVGLESTVVDATGVPLRILRPGFVTLEDLRRVVRAVAGPSGRRGRARSPGLRHRHYQPSCKVVLARAGDWMKTLERLARKHGRIGALSLTRPIPRDPRIVFKRRFHGDRRRYARALYRSFFDAERGNVRALVVESLSKKGLGLAIMDRLARAAR